MVRNGALPGVENLAFHGALFVTGALSLVTKKDWAHYFLSLAALTLILAYVVLLFANLA